MRVDSGIYSTSKKNCRPIVPPPLQSVHILAEWEPLFSAHFTYRAVWEVSPSVCLNGRRRACAHWTVVKKRRPLFWVWMREVWGPGGSVRGALFSSHWKERVYQWDHGGGSSEGSILQTSRNSDRQTTSKQYSTLQRNIIPWKWLLRQALQLFTYLPWSFLWSIQESFVHMYVST